MDRDTHPAESKISLDRAATLGLALLASIAFGLLMRAVWQPADVLLNRYIVDDFFYYLQVAWNYAEFGSLSLDGRNTTNGFHPLYMGILLVLKPLAGDDKLRFMQLALTTLAAAHVATGVLLARGFRRIMPERPVVALAPAFLWLIWKEGNAFPLMGLESSLLSAGLAFSFYAFVRLDGSWKRDLVLGAALSLSALARIDALLLIPIVGIWILFPMRTLGAEALRQAPRRMFAINAIVILVMGTYLAANVLYFDHAVPMSGRVKSARTLGRDWHPEMSSAERIAYVSKSSFSKHHTPGDQQFKRRSAMLLGLLGFEILVALARRRERLRDRLRGLEQATLPQFVPWLVYAGAVHLYYLTVQGSFSHGWYLLHSSLILCVYLAHWSTRLVTRLPDKALATVGALLLALLLIRDFPIREATKIRPTRFAYDVALWTNQNLAPGTRIGVHNAGVLAYFSHCAITNLDGLVNNSAGQAIIEHRLGEYVESQDLAYIADFRRSVGWSTAFAKDNYVKRLYVAVANFGNPTSWVTAGDYVFLKRRQPEARALAIRDAFIQP